MGIVGTGTGTGPIAERARQHFEALVRGIPNTATILCDRELRIVRVDGPELAVNGFSRETMEGFTIHECLPPAFAAVIEPNLRRVLAGESFTAELPFGDLWYRYNYLPIHEPDGTIEHAMIVALNITAQRRIEARLLENEARFATMVMTSPDATILSTLADGRMLEVNPAFERVFGWTRAEALGKTAFELGTWAEPDRRGDLRQLIERDGGVEGLVVGVCTRTGTPLDALISVRPVTLDGERCIVTVLRDVTEERKREQARRDAEARLRALAAATFEGIAVTDRGLIVDVNDQIAAMYRTTRDAVIGRQVGELVAPESREAVEAHMRSGSAAPYEHVALRGDGTRFLVEVRGRPIEVAGQVRRFTAIRDITERKLAEAERDRLITELRARNAEMEQFTYTVSHDLKSPLVTITGFLGMLERDLAAGDAARVASDLKTIGSAAMKMQRLLEDLLELSRIGRVGKDHAPVALGEVVADALELVSGPLAERGVTVTVAPELPTTIGDRTRLVQVFQNVVENAVKYMGTQAAPAIAIRVRRAAHPLEIEVVDNGLGIDPRFHERIFGLFEKLDPRSPGTGVGLALVRRILEFHGGAIFVESDGQSGSTFVLRFPGTDGG